MPSHSILPEARRAAIEAAFDEALAEVRASGNVALLQECRAIFRKRVPLTLRAYVAAALALKGSGASRPADKRGRFTETGRNAEPGRDSRGDRNARPGNERQPASVQKKTEKPKKEAVVREVREPRSVAESGEVREPREVRENRYRGEGVTLFVSAGRRQRFYARVAIKVLLDIPGVSDEVVGDIRTMDNYSFIVVDPAVEDVVIAGLGGYDFKGRILAANRARKRGESAPSLEEGREAQGVDQVADRTSGSFASSDDSSDSTDSSDSSDSYDDDDSGVELEAFGSGSDDDQHADESFGDEDETTEDA